MFLIWKYYNNKMHSNGPPIWAVSQKGKMHLLKIFAVILLQNMHLHDETEAQVHLKDIY